MRRRGFGGGGEGGGGLEGNIQLALPPPQRESGQAKPMRQTGQIFKQGIQTVNNTNF
jgi:hypothetical protein